MKTEEIRTAVSYIVDNIYELLPKNRTQAEREEIFHGHLKTLASLRKAEIGPNPYSEALMEVAKVLDEGKSAQEALIVARRLRSQKS